MVNWETRGQRVTNLQRQEESFSDRDRESGQNRFAPATAAARVSIRTGTSPLQASVFGLFASAKDLALHTEEYVEPKSCLFRKLGFTAKKGTVR